MNERVWLDRLPGWKAADWPAIAEELRANEGKWMLLGSAMPSTVARALAQGSIRVLDPELGFRSATRNNTYESPRTCDIYLSYHPVFDEPPRVKREKKRAAKPDDAGQTDS